MGQTLCWAWGTHKRSPLLKSSELLGNRDTKTRASAEMYPVARKQAEGATQEETWRRLHKEGGGRLGRALKDSEAESGAEKRDLRV